jgi:hypothetical protein
MYLGTVIIGLTLEIVQSGISGSSPQTADPALLAAADPARFAAENGELTVALFVER